MMSQRPYVDFREIKQVVSLPEVLEVFGIRDQFRQAEQTLTGVCPLPQHEHGPCPNPEQFKATVRDGVWLWHCFGDCHRGGDVIELVKLITGYENGHVRFWFAEHFADRLTLKKPKRNKSERLSTEKEEAREVEQEPQRAKSNVINGNLPTNQPSLKPLRFHLKLETDVPYLWRRGLQPETIQRYGLGLCQKGMLAGYVAIPVFGYPKDEAERRIKELREAAAESEFAEELEAFFGTYDCWREGILAYLEDHKNSGVVEGINNKARVITRRSFGIKSAQALWTRLVLDVNQAAESAGYTLRRIKELTCRIKARFCGHYT